MSGDPTATVDPGQPDAERDLPPSRPKAGRLLLRASIGAGLIAFLLSRADLGSVMDSLREASYGHVAAACVLALMALILGGVRWRPYLDRLGFEVPIGVAIRLSMIGAFFNAFLPTGVGGDAYKAFRVRRGPGTISKAFASVVLDRTAGVVGMATLAVLGGVLVLSVVNVAGPHARLRGDRWPWLMRSHLTLFGPETTDAVLRRSGFRMVEWSMLPRALHLSYLAARACRSFGMLGDAARTASRFVDPRIPAGWLGDVAFVVARPVSDR